MTDEKRAIIEGLAAEAHAKSLVAAQLAMCNAYAEPEIARANAIRYAVAQAEAAEARQKLEDACRPT